MFQGATNYWTEPFVGRGVFAKMSIRDFENFTSPTKLELGLKFQVSGSRITLKGRWSVSIE